MRLTIWFEPSKLVAGAGALRYYDPITGKKTRVYIKSKADLKIEKNRLETMLLNWKAGKGTASIIPLVLFEEYLEAKRLEGLRPSTLAIKRQSLLKFLETIFTMDQLTTPLIKSWAAQLSKAHKIDTVSIRLRDLRAFLRWAHKEGHIDSNPFTGIQIPSSTFVGRRISITELQGLFSNASGWFKDFLTIAIETGARHGEILGMEWTDVNLNEGAWVIPAAKCKTKRARTIPLSAKVINVLKARTGQPGSRVFEGATRYMTQDHWNQTKAKCRIAGRMRLHDLRHTWASNWRGRASSLRAVAGWRSDEMMHHYTHVELNELREDMAKSGFGADLGQLGVKK